MKCEKVQKEAAKREKFVPNAASSYVSQSYTHSLSLSPSLLPLSFSFHCLVALPVPPPLHPRLSLLPAVFSVGSLPEALLLWQDSALRAKIVH